MARWNPNNVNRPHSENAAVNTALSSYEKALFEKILQKKDHAPNVVK